MKTQEELFKIKALIHPDHIINKDMCAFNKKGHENTGRGLDSHEKTESFQWPLD